MKKILGMLVFLLLPAVAWAGPYASLSGSYIPEQDYEYNDGFGSAGAVIGDDGYKLNARVGMDQKYFSYGIKGGYNDLSATLDGLEADLDMWTAGLEGCLTPSVGAYTIYGCSSVGIAFGDVGIKTPNIDFEGDNFTAAYYDLSVGAERALNRFTSLFVGGGWFATFDDIDPGMASAGLPDARMNVDHAYIEAGVKLRF